MNMSSTQDGIDQQGNVTSGGIRGGTMSGRLHDAVAPLAIRDISLENIIVPAIAMTGACLAVVSIAGAVKRGSPWAGINSIASGLGLTAVRPSRSFDPVVTLAGIGTAIGGSFILAGIHHLVSRSIGRTSVGRAGGGRRLLGGVLTSLAAVTMDKLFMRDAIFPAFANALGFGGTVLKYGAIGAAAAVSSR